MSNSNSVKKEIVESLARSVKEEIVESLVRSVKEEENNQTAEIVLSESSGNLSTAEMGQSSNVSDASIKRYEIILPVRKGTGDVSVRELSTIQAASCDSNVIPTSTTLQREDVPSQIQHQETPNVRQEAVQDKHPDSGRKMEVQKEIGEHSGAGALKKVRRKFDLMTDNEGDEVKERREKYLRLSQPVTSDEEDDMNDLFFDNDPDFNPANDDDDEWGLQKVPKKKKATRGGGGRGRGRPRGRGGTKKEFPSERRSSAYKDEWEQDRRLADWLAPGKSGSKAWCRACLTHLKPIKNDLIAHSTSDRHKQRMKKLIDEPEEPTRKETRDSVADGQEASKTDSKPRRSRPKKVRVVFFDEDEDNDPDLDEGESEKGGKRKSDSDEDYLAAYKTTDGKPPKKKNKEEEKEKEGEEEEESIPIMEFEAVLAIEETMMMQQEEHKAQMAYLQRKMECEEEELQEEIKILKEQNMLLMMQKHNEQINNAKLQMDINRLQAGINTFSVVTYDAI